MQSQALRILMLFWVLLWFGVIVPGHTRGMLRLPGSESVELDGAREATNGPTCSIDASLPSCCQQPGSPTNNDRKTPPLGTKCAICHMAANLDAPPAPVAIVELHRIALPLSDRVSHLYALAALSDVLGRGPPA